MCLVIDNEKHRRLTLTFVDKKLKRFPVARITRQDIIVYKKLDVGKNFIQTPYMNTDIVFKDGKCIMNAKFGKRLIQRSMIPIIYMKVFMLLLIVNIPIIQID